EAMSALPAFRNGLDRVMKATRGHRMCLMCAEREPLDCHRCLLVGRALAERGHALGHILVDGKIEPQTATEDRLLGKAGPAVDLFSSRADRLAEAYRKR